VVSIYVLNAHSTLLRNSGYHMNLYSEQCGLKLLQNNNLQHGKKTQNWGGGGSCSVLGMSDGTVQNSMRNGLSVQKNDVSPTEWGEEVGETYLQPRFQEDE